MRTILDLWTFLPKSVYIAGVAVLALIFLIVYVINWGK
jgi:hypothetical protein